MAEEQNYGSFQPFIDGLHQLGKRGGLYHDPAPAPQQPVDTSYHDAAVAAANQSFIHRQEPAMADKHIVHEIHRPQGHGYMDQKYGKGNRSPIGSQVPYVNTHEVPNSAAGDMPTNSGSNY